MNIDPIDLRNIDGAALIKLAIAFALALGAKDMVGKLGHKLARMVLDFVKSTRTPLDDKPGALLASFIRAASDAAKRGDFDAMADVVKSAFFMPPPVDKPRASLPPIIRAAELDDGQGPPR